MHRLLARQIKKYLPEGTELSPPVKALLEAVDQAYADGDESRELLRRSMELSSRELVERNAALVAAEGKYRSIFENATQGIFQIAPDGRYLTVNPALAEMCGYGDPAEMLAACPSAAAIYVDPQRWATLAGELASQGSLERQESEIRTKDGARRWISESTRPVLDAGGGLLHYEGTSHDITATKQAEAERAALQSQLLQASRMSGMAEVATSVLHNVGNVLNSLEVAWSLATKRASGLRLANLSKLAKMLEEHAHDLPGFCAPGGKGAQVPAYLGQLAASLSDEQGKILHELGTLGQHLEHVKRVVQMQQSYAKNTGVCELLEVHALVEDALKLAKTASSMEEVEIVREFEAVPPATIDKHRVLEILVNLLTNAGQAMEVAPQKRLTLSVRRLEDRDTHFLISVRDSGSGIAPENLTRIFNHGFTTKRGGHGFGLHSAALAAHAMNGALRAHSEGPGQGAVFTLELPLDGIRRSLSDNRKAA